MATRIQTKANGNASASSISAVMDSNVTAGNKLVVICKGGADFTPSTSHISDTQGNTYVMDWSAADNLVDITSLGDYVVYSTTIGSTGACTVTFNPAVSGRISIAVREYSGLGDHDGSTRSITYLTNSTTPSSGNITPSAATGVIFALLSCTQFNSFEADYTDTTNDGDGRFLTAVDEAVTAAAQSADATLDLTTFWDCGAIWYPDAAAASAPDISTWLPQDRKERGPRFRVVSSGFTPPQKVN
jgi:hypothetical protein